MLTGLEAAAWVLAGPARAMPAGPLLDRWLRLETLDAGCD